MNVDWQSFTLTGAVFSFIGGLTIGISSVWLALANGKIAGISGIFVRLVDKAIYKESGQYGWQISFISGLIVSPFIWSLFNPLPQISYTSNLTGLLISGILVGFGTRLANGCTSGHGICGLSRLSINSLIAVFSFMTSGFLTVYISKHLLGL